MAHIEGAFLQLDRRMESLERTLDGRFNQFEGHFNQLETRFSIVDQRFNWLTGILVTSWISTIVTVLLHC